MKKSLIIIGVALVLVVGLVLSYANRLPKADENVKASWAQVQNQYKRRAELIPNLVEVVKGYAKHEKDTLKEVIDARSRATQVNINNPQDLKAVSEAQKGLSSALSKLMLVVERYPELKADKNFLALQSQLEGTENRIVVARKDYIEKVRAYNLELRMIPNRFINALLYPDAKIKETFKAQQTEQKAPKVKF